MKKECFKCGGVKPLHEFYKHKGMKDGHLNKCKACNKIDAAEHRAKNIDRIRAYDRDRGSRQGSEYNREYRTRYPKKYKAQTMVGNHLRAGNLHKESCEVCGIDGAVAHHDDYDKPLNVRWLCQAHHKQWHSENGEGRNGI